MSLLRHTPPKQTIKSLPQIKIGSETLPIHIRINRRAKRIILKVDPMKRVVLITCPTKRSYLEAIDFAHERAFWIAERLAEAPPRHPFAEGASIPLRGIEHVLIQDKTRQRSVRQMADEKQLLVGGEPAFMARRVTDFLKKEARKDLTAATDQFCLLLNKERRKISVRDTRTRWGSCASDGTLSYSWRLILAPPYVLRYVAAHEAGHLVHMDHSADFWAVVDSLIEDRKEAQRWLSANGAILHSYGV